jgi:phage replication O-like protein O
MSTATSSTTTTQTKPQYKKIKPITDSKSLFRNLLNAAIDKKLKQNELKVFIFLLEKTLGYGKRSDRLTTGVIAHSTQIRKDHAKKAIAGLLKSGLFNREKSRHYEFRYTIGKTFLAHFDGIFFTPALPKFGHSLPKLEDAPENWEHTSLDLNPSLSLPIPPRPTLTVNLGLGGDDLPKERRCGCQIDEDNFQARPSLTAGVDFIPYATQSAATPIQHSQWRWQESGLTIPSSISKNNHNFCINILQKGSLQQAQDTLSVYNEMQDKGLVRNPPLLLKTLAKLSIKGELALPQANTTAITKAPFIPLVPNTLDDKLTVYAKKHGFSEAPMGFGYREYRSMLRKEREARLVMLEKQALQPVN